MIALRLVSAQTGDALATFRETADNQSELLPTVDRLAKEVRAKIGESLKSVQSAQPLEQVTTPSLEALRKYVDGLRIIYDGDFPRGEALLQEAVALDTGFAMAYRKLAVEYGNRQLTEKAQAYYEKAYAHIDRLSDPERYLLLGSYYSLGRHQDAAKAQAAFERLLEIQPDNTAGMNNLSILLLSTHQPARAESLLVRAIRVGPVASVHYRNLMRARVAMGQVDSARTTAAACAKAFPKNSDCVVLLADLQWSLGEFESLGATLAALEPRMTSPEDRAIYDFDAADLARLHGKLDESARLETDGTELRRQSGVAAAALQLAVGQAFDQAWFRGDAAGAVRRLDDALATTPLRSVPMSEAPYSGAVSAYAIAGQPDRARAIMAEWDARRRDVADDARYRPSPPNARRDRAGRARLFHRAVRASRHGEAGLCRVRPSDARSRLRPRRRSRFGDRRLRALRHHEVARPRRLRTPCSFRRCTSDWASCTKRRGSATRRSAHYRSFLELWKNADPVLQPKVQDAQQRVAALTRGTDTRR